jgi:hypothetical protein
MESHEKQDRKLSSDALNNEILKAAHNLSSKIEKYRNDIKRRARIEEELRRTIMIHEKSIEMLTIQSQGM